MTSEGPVAPPFRIRTLTLGIALAAVDDLSPATDALAALGEARERFARAGFEVQTIRLATSLLQTGRRDQTSMQHLQALDRLAAGRGALVSLGPLPCDRETAEATAGWLAELNETTGATHLSVPIAGERGVNRAGVLLAAQVMRAVARPFDGGLGNFRFGAAAGVPSGTPFFPVAWHGGGPPTLTIGVEGAPIVRHACEGATLESVPDRVAAVLDGALTPVDRLARATAAHLGWHYAGIDPSPAPLADRSIVAAVEAVTRRPFGEMSTLSACAAITAGLRTLAVPTCGYAGLMLPVLEDAVLAARVVERRVTLQQLLLYSAVCGTGLDVVPLPGDTSVSGLSAILTDVAALSVRLRKPLAARLLPVPGLKAGDVTSFDDPYLVNTAVLAATT